MAKAKKKEALSLEEKLEQALVLVDEQPYEVPENWCWIRIKSILDIVVGATPSTSHKEYYSNGTIAWLPSGCCQDCIVYKDGANHKMITKEGYDSCSTKLMPPDTVMIALTGATAGKVGYLSFEACGNQSIVGLLPNKSISSKFVYYQLMSRRKEILSDCVGSAQPHISKEYVSNMVIAVPPLSEQQRIVEQIESLFVKLDEAKEKAESVLDSFDKRKAALFNMAFTGRLTEQWRKINDIDKDKWISTTIGDVSEIITKGASPRWQGIEYTDDKTQTLFVTSENVREGYLDLSKEKYLDNRINEIQKRSVLHCGDVLVNIVGASIGRAAIYSLEKLANTNQAVCIVRLKNKEINDYVCFYLNSPTAQQYYYDNKVETARANISLTNISSMPIMLPPEDERREIMSKLKYLLEKEDASKEMVNNLIDNLELMKKSILAKAFRGELGTNNPAEESAVELLKSILATE